MNDHEARIAVLEKLSQSCDQQREDTNRRIDHLEGKLDEHLASNAASQVEMTRAVTRLVTTVESMADDLKTALTGSLLAVKHETIAQALLWVGAGLVTLAGGGWAIFTWLVK